MSREPAPRRAGVGVVWWVIFLDLLGFGMVLPSLAYYVHIFEVPSIAVAAGARLGITEVPAVFVGLIQTSYSLLQFFCAPLWGRLSDRIGRRPVLLASLAGFTAAWVLFALAPSMVWLLAARAMAGAFGANISTAQAYMADVYPAEQRAKGMGLIGMAFGVGFVFGPALGAVLSSDAVVGWFVPASSPGFLRAHLLVPGLCAAGFSATALLLGLFRLKESLPPEARVQAEVGHEGELHAVWHALRRPGIGPMLLIHFVVIMGFASLESMFSEFNLQQLHLGHSANGWIFSGIGLTMAVVQGGLIGRVSARVGSARVLIFGLSGMALAMVIFGFQVQLNPGLERFTWSMLTSVLTGAFYGFCNPSVLALISRQAASSAQGGTMGLTSSAATLGRIVGPLLSGVVYASLGPEWPFALGGLVLAAALGFFLVLRGQLLPSPA